MHRRHRPEQHMHTTHQPQFAAHDEPLEHQYNRARRTLVACTRVRDIIVEHQHLYIRRIEQNVQPEHIRAAFAEFAESFNTVIVFLQSIGVSACLSCLWAQRN